MNYQKTFKDLADSGAISGYRASKGSKSWPLVLVTLAFTALVIGGLIYGLYNASQIERASVNACVAVNDPTCTR